MKLYEIAQEYQVALNNLYDEETGEINETALLNLNEIREPLEKKCISVVKYFKGLDAERKAIEDEKKKMAARESAYKKQVDSLKEYLLYNMVNSKVEKISCPEFVITLRKNRASVDDFDPAIIPDEYKKVEVTTKKMDILRELKNGVVIPGARIKYDPYIEIR